MMALLSDEEVAALNAGRQRAFHKLSVSDRVTVRSCIYLLAGADDAEMVRELMRAHCNGVFSPEGQSNE